MSTPKHNEPVVLIIITSMIVYGIIKGKKLDFLGHKLRHHVIHPTMKALKMKTVMERELKRELVH